MANRSRPIRRVSSVYSDARRKERQVVAGTLMRWLIGGLFTLALLSGLGLVIAGPQVRIRSVIVANAVLSNEQQIREAVPQGQWLFQSLAPTSEIIAGLPFVNSVSIERQYPDTIVITVEEPQPVAVLTQPTQFVLLDSEGVVLASFDTQTYTERYAQESLRRGWIPIEEAVTLPVKEGDQVTGRLFMRFLEDYQAALTPNNLRIALVRLGDVLHMPEYVLESGQVVAVNALTDPVVSAQNTVRMTQRAGAQPNERIDLTVPRWAYVRPL